MKSLRVLSPIEPGELCWVRVDGEWWLVRAEIRKTEGCGPCEFLAYGLALCERIPCGDMAFIRVHPIPMPAEVNVGDIVERGGMVFIVVKWECCSVCYFCAEDDCLPEFDCTGGKVMFTRIGPPEE